jgi:hypothetical protein
VAANQPTKFSITRSLLLGEAAGAVVALVVMIRKTKTAIRTYWDLESSPIGLSM